MHRSIHFTLCGISASLLLSCAAAPPKPETPRPTRYRPGWLATVDTDVAAMSACLEGREKPSHIVFTFHGPSGAIGVTTSDAYGQLEECAVQGDKVVLREKSRFAVADLGGLPLFSMGPSIPPIPVGAIADEVVVGGEVYGWLTWPQASGRDALGEAQDAMDAAQEEADEAGEP